MLIPPEWSGWSWRFKALYIALAGAGVAALYFGARWLVYGY